MYDRDTLLVKVATMYYEHGYTQTNISKELGISRPTIATLLSEAIENNIVQIIISHPNKQLIGKQDQLGKYFPNTEIHIASALNGNNNPRAAVGHSTAQLLIPLLDKINSIGVGWGTTLAEVIGSINYVNHSHLNIYPLIGGVVFSDIKYHANHLASELAQKTNGKVDYLYAPAIAETLEIKQSFFKSDMIQSILTKSKQVDVALIGIGNPIVNSNYKQHGYLTSDEIDELNDSKVVGDILTTFFDNKGNIVNSDITKRMIGLSISDLNNIDAVIAVATGEEKALSTKLVLEKEFISYLIIDEVLADQLLKILEIDSID